jgi:hypothetical protein
MSDISGTWFWPSSGKEVASKGASGVLVEILQGKFRKPHIWKGLWFRATTKTCVVPSA